jgi:hypothetical protein
MMAAATAPTARADDFTDVINKVDADLTAGQSYFIAAVTDFGQDVADRRRQLELPLHRLKA